MPDGTSNSPGAIRNWVESLLRVHDAAAQQTAEVEKSTATAAVRAAALVSRADVPQSPAVADLIAAAGRSMTATVHATAQETSVRLATQAHQLLDLLAVKHHQADPLPPLDTIALSAGNVVTAFAPGFGRDYVSSIMRDLDRSKIVTKTDAKAQPGIQPTDVSRARWTLVSKISPKNRRQARKLLEHEECHAVEMHGPQVSDQELALRVAWRRPPDHGLDTADEWRVRDDGKVISKHGQGGWEAYAFTSPEAFARPLDAFLDLANSHPGGLDGYLDEHAMAGRATFFMSADLAGLRPGDAVGYRGAGTHDRNAAKDWRRSRADAMKKDDVCGPPAPIVRLDPIAAGARPGVRISFLRHAGSWTMITYYPTEAPLPDNLHLGEPT